MREVSWQLYLETLFKAHEKEHSLISIHLEKEEKMMNLRLEKINELQNQFEAFRNKAIGLVVGVMILNGLVTTLIVMLLRK